MKVLSVVKYSRMSSFVDCTTERKRDLSFVTARRCCSAAFSACRRFCELKFLVSYRL